MTSLIYKRTHRGDPNENGIFGIHDCLGRVRQWHFHSVIGVGGASPDPGHKDLALKINWIGIGAHKHPASPRHRAPVVTFRQFILLNEKGLLLEDCAPQLFKHMFHEKRRRLTLSTALDQSIRDEVDGILIRAAADLSMRASSMPPDNLEQFLPEADDCKCVPRSKAKPNC